MAVRSATRWPRKRRVPSERARAGIRLPVSSTKANMTSPISVSMNSMSRSSGPKSSDRGGSWFGTGVEVRFDAEGRPIEDLEALAMGGASETVVEADEGETLRTTLRGEEGRRELERI